MDKIDVVKNFIAEVVNGGNLAAIECYWHEDMAWHGGSLGDYHGIAAYKAMAEANVGAAFTEMHLTIDDIFASGDKVVSRFRNSGRHTGEFMGKAATGKTAEWHGIGIYQVRDGKIKEAWFTEDILAIWTQLDLIS